MEPGTPTAASRPGPGSPCSLAVLALAFFVAKGCEDDEVEVTEEEAVELAEEEVDFEPTYTQVRLLRQGINRAAFWFVSLSIPIGFDRRSPRRCSRSSRVVEDRRSHGRR